MNSAIILEHILLEMPQRLHQFTEVEFGKKPAPNMWSKQQILGHLVDSAANNHQRFVRIMAEDSPVIWYDQNVWNDAGNYQTFDKKTLIELWENYNHLLLHIIRNIPQSKLERLCYSGQPEAHTLEWFIDDYVDHLNHHLSQILLHG